MLIVTPLAVSFQTERGGRRSSASRPQSSRDGSVTAGITITNYERLHLFDPADFGGMVCDESSAIKSFDGVRRAIVTDFMRKMRYRLLCTATAAPNDYIELGTSSEALGYLGHMDMLGRFFTNENSTSDTEGPLEGLRRTAMRSPVSSGGSRATPRTRSGVGLHRGRGPCVGRPTSGSTTTGSILPPLEHRQHIVEARTSGRRARCSTCRPSASTRNAQEQRRTIQERCEPSAELLADADSAVAWCQLNDEGDLLARLIPGAVQVSRLGRPRQQGGGAGGVLARRDPGAGHEAEDRRVGPELAALPPDDVLPVPLLRAVLPGRPALVAVRPDAAGARSTS